MPARRKRILFVVADGARARFFEGARIGGPLKELEAQEMHAAPVEAARSPLPRVHDRFGPARHAVEPRRSPRTASEAHFARQVAETTDQLAAGFDEVVVCAAPAVLGLMREYLSDDVAGKLAAEFAKDYVRQAPVDLSASLAKIAE